MTDYDRHFIYPAGSDKYTATALPDRTPFSPRFKHHDFKHGVTGTMEIEGYYINVFIPFQRQNSNMCLKKLSFYMHKISKFGIQTYPCCDETNPGSEEVYEKMQKLIFKNIEEKIFNNEEPFQDMIEY